MPQRPTIQMKRRDWRDFEHREELFKRYFTWRHTVHDLDHSHYCKVLTDGMTRDKKAWFSLCFGLTYRTPQAYAFVETFPVLEEIDLDDLFDWNHDNWKRCTYGTDARYNKGHFADQVENILKWCGEETLLGKIERLTSGDDPILNFETLITEIMKLYKFGRMTGWIACQGLYDTLGLNIDFNNVFVRSPTGDSSMQSIWNGYCMLKGHEHRLLGKQYSTNDYRPSEEDLKEVSDDVMRYKDKAEKWVDKEVDIFKWESIWCQFKRLFREKESKEYPGHSSGDAVSRYIYYRDEWPELNWYPFREALLSQPSMIRGMTYKSEFNKVFGEHGLLLNMHEMYDDLPNAYRILGIDPNNLLVRSLFRDHGHEVPLIEKR